MNLLAIDTAANLCAACVYDTERGEELGRAVIDIGTGHAERLMAVIAEALGNAQLRYKDLGAIAVAVGPGSFTGVRVGVSAARGFALALKVPAIGVTTLEALAHEAQETFPGRAVLAVIDARRGEVYSALYDEQGALRSAPMVSLLETVLALATEYRPVLAGSAAALVADSSDKAEIASRSATADIAVYARLAASKPAGGDKPKPLYLRGADAKPQAGYALPRRAG